MRLLSLTVFLTRFCDWLNRQISALTAIILFFMLILAGSAVFFRYVLGDALNWMEDVILPAFVWMGLLGTSIAFRLKGHIRIDSVMKLIPIRAREHIDRLTQLTIIAFSGYLTIQGIKVVHATRGMPWGVLQLPPTYFYVAFPISFFIIFIYGTDDFLKGLRETHQN
jgi:TRAP-type C4-dicarboxylate transport system permease small subunit